MSRPIGIFCAGEFLMDLITAEFVQTLEEAVLFQRIPGGSPANLCMNMARLGHKTMLAATVGNDDMGRILRGHIEKLGVDVSCLAVVEEPTTLVLCTRSAAESNFQVYRGADAMVSIRQFPYARFEEIRIFHTTCFALSRKPAQSAIMQAVEKAERAKCTLSIDLNYSEKIWADRKEAQRIVAEYCRLGSLVKVSDVDWYRLYEEERADPAEVVDHFLKMGAAEVCYTLGGDGCWVGNTVERHFIPGRKTAVKDTTGVGDAFWAGYLTARLDGKHLKDCGLAGRKMAEIKLSTSVTLPDEIDRERIYEDIL